MRLRCRIGIHRCPMQTNTRCLCCDQRFHWDADHGKLNLDRQDRARRRREAREARWAGRR